MNYFKNKDKITFIISFLIIYSLLLWLALKFLAHPLLELQVNLIKSLFGSFFNYSGFLFVNECSGVVSIITYLSIILALTTIRLKEYLSRKVFFYSISLLFINFLRLIIVLLSGKISLGFARAIHILFWFVMGGIILLFVLRSRKS